LSGLQASSVHLAAASRIMTPSRTARRFFQTVEINPAYMNFAHRASVSGRMRENMHASDETGTNMNKNEQISLKKRNNLEYNGTNAVG
jgi:hypothetical protein